MMDIGDVVPFFTVLFMYVLPTILIVVFLAITYKLIKRFIRAYEKIKKKMEREMENLGRKMLELVKGLSDVTFLDAVPTMLLVYPLILMVLMLITKHADYMLMHFWDYTYPALGILSVSAMMEIWTHTMYYFFREVMRI